MPHPPSAVHVPQHVLVVGAGLAGARTVLELRARGFAGEVTLVGAEGLPPYDRPPLSKHLLDRTTPAWLSDELGADATAAADRVLLSTRAMALEPATDPTAPLRVDVAGPDGDGVLTADVVVAATGSTPVRPWSAASSLHTAADADRLRAALRPGGRLVVVGAGWIGAEVATVAAAHGVQVTVLETAGAPLAGTLGVQVGRWTAGWYGRAGVRLETEARVVRVHDGGVDLADGRSLPADAVLAAVGARPASQWLAGALPLRDDGAVLVGAGYAPVAGPQRIRVLGDLARRRSPRHGEVAGGHWDAALRGPALAVADLLGHRPPEDPGTADPAPYVFSTQLGHELALYGSPGRDDQVVPRGDPAADGWTALWFAPGTDRLTAVLAVDRPRDVAGARRLFAEAQLPVLDRTRAAAPAPRPSHRASPPEHGPTGGLLSPPRARSAGRRRPPARRPAHHRSAHRRARGGRPSTAPTAPSLPRSPPPALRSTRGRSDRPAE